MGDSMDGVGGLIGLGVGLYVAKKVFDGIDGSPKSYQCGICGKRYPRKIQAQNCCLNEKKKRVGGVF